MVNVCLLKMGRHPIEFCPDARQTLATIVVLCFRGGDRPHEEGPGSLRVPSRGRAAAVLPDLQVITNAR